MERNPDFEAYAGASCKVSLCLYLNNLIKSYPFTIGKIRVRGGGA